MFTLTLSIIIGVFLFDLTLSILNYRYRNTPIPALIQDVYDNAAYSDWLKYNMEVTRLSIISKVADLLLILVIFLTGLFPWIANLANQFVENRILQTLLFLGMYSAISYVFSIGFQIYRTFSIEQRYGFNKVTPKVFFTDQIKSMILGAVLGGGILYILLSLYEAMGRSSLIYSWALLISISLILNVLYIKIFVKLFNKLTPIEEGELHDKIVELAQKTGYEVKQISIMDASKRSTKLNAFFSGFGKFKHIILYDTLIEKCSIDQIVSILAHEIGHAKHKDVLKNFLVMIVQSGVFLFILSYFLSSGLFANAFGFSTVHYGFALILFNILMRPVALVLGVPLSAHSRTAEYRADAFAGNVTQPKDMIQALKVLARENYSNLTPHPLLVKMTYSHPPVGDRVKALLELEKN